MNNARRKISFVSGKGGVGKTLLAANFARCVSTVRRTLLIDFDFQNQGASGLLASYLKPGCLNAFDLLMSDGARSASPIEIRSNLFFAPAFDPSKTDRIASQLTSPFHSVTCENVDGALEQLLTCGNYEVIIADCHGGLDDVSFAMFISSDMTFIVTEADKVTFNGTLELLDFYIDRAAGLAPKSAVECESSQDVTSTRSHGDVARRISNIEYNKVRFLVNRISGKFTYNALSTILSRQLYANIDVLQKMNEGFSFIPSDPLAAESFSEHPFYTELMPESVFVQKIELIYTQMFGENPNIRGRAKFYTLFERMQPAKLQHYMRSPHDVRVQAVFSFIAGSQFVFFVATVAIAILSSLIKMNDILDYNPTVSQSIGSAFTILLALVFFYMARFNMRINGFYRDRMRYELRLYRYGGRWLSVAFSTKLVRLSLFRLVLLLLAFIYIVFGITIMAAIGKWYLSEVLRLF
jgi:cellulose biosynthesis protein BcsQ